MSSRTRQCRRDNGINKLISYLYPGNELEMWSKEILTEAMSVKRYRQPSGWTVTVWQEGSDGGLKEREKCWETYLEQTMWNGETHQKERPPSTNTS